jgi:hypothetical protein
MFGMVTALVVNPATTASATFTSALGFTPNPSADPIRSAAVAAGSTSTICRIPGATG